MVQNAYENSVEQRRSHELAHVCVCVCANRSSASKHQCVVVAVAVVAQFPVQSSPQLSKKRCEFYVYILFAWILTRFVSGILTMSGFFRIDALIHYNSFDMKIGRTVGRFCVLVWRFCIIYMFRLYSFRFVFLLRVLLLLLLLFFLSFFFSSSNSSSSMIRTEAKKAMQRYVVSHIHSICNASVT